MRLVECRFESNCFAVYVGDYFGVVVEKRFSWKLYFFAEGFVAR